jgi:hypothetical protein
VQGDYYPPPTPRALGAQIMSVIKLLLIGLVIAGVDPFPYLNAETPNAWNWAIQNKVSTSSVLALYVARFSHSSAC